MTARTNRLIGGDDRGHHFQAGSPEARMQLQEHCDKLNTLKGEREWIVIRASDGKLTIDSRPRRATPDAPRCTPHEARDILRRYGLQGSGFAKAILASLGEYEAVADAA